MSFLITVCHGGGVKERGCHTAPTECQAQRRMSQPAKLPGLACRRSKPTSDVDVGNELLTSVHNCNIQLQCYTQRANHDM